MNKVNKILAYIVLVISVIMVAFATIIQFILEYEKFGYILNGSVGRLIPHWSLWFYLALIPLFISGYIVKGE